jgi:hypothetical protein
MARIRIYILVAIVVNAALIGCGGQSAAIKSSWHEKFDWKAEDYFDDPKVVALCKAIAANNLGEIARLISDGAHVNAKGKGNMTPLLWAFPDNKLDRFKRLLELGADPNITVESEFNTHGGISPGDSVTHLAAATSFPGYLEAVFRFKANPNLVRKSKLGSRDTPIFTVITGRCPDKIEGIKLLVTKGADLNYLNGGGVTPTMEAASRGFYNLALVLLESGADPHIYQSNGLMKLTHVLYREESRLPYSAPQQKADYHKLVHWLDKHGESIEQARSDEKRWESWGAYGSEKKAKLMEAERKSRLAREASKVDAETAAHKAKETGKKAAATISDPKKK